MNESRIFLRYEEGYGSGDSRILLYPWKWNTTGKSSIELWFSFLRINHRWNEIPAVRSWEQDFQILLKIKGGWVSARQQHHPHNTSCTLTLKSLSHLTFMNKSLNKYGSYMYMYSL